MYSKLIFTLLSVLVLTTTNYAAAPKNADVKKSAERAAIKMPSAEKLAQYLSNEGFDHFAEKTKIHEKLGGQEKYPAGVLIQMELSLSDYDQYMKDPMISALMKMRKEQLLATLLKEFPAELKQLKEQLKDFEDASSKK